MAAPIPGLGDIGNPTANQQSPLPFNSRPSDPSQAVAPPTLQPVAHPLDTFMASPRFAQANQAQNLGRIADSLSAFQPALQNYSQVFNQVANQQAENKLQPLVGLSGDQLQTQLQQNPDLQNEAAQRLGGVMLGNKVAEEWKQQALQDYNDPTKFDKSTGNVNQFLSDSANALVQKYGNNPWISRGMSDTVNTVKAGLMGEQTKFQINQANTTREDLLNSTFSNHIQNGIAKGMSADDIMKDITSTIATTKQLSGMPRPQQAEVVMDAVKKSADGLMLDPNWDKTSQTLMGILKADRGNGAGSLFDSSQTGGKAAQLMDEIQRTATQKYEQSSSTLADIRRQAADGDPAYKDRLNQELQAHPYISPGMIQRADYAFDTARQRSVGMAFEASGKAIDKGIEANQIGGPVLDAVQNGTARSTVQPFTYTTYRGDSRTLSPEDQIKGAVAMKQANIDKQFPPGDPSTQDQRVAAMLPMYASNAVKNEEWTGMLKAGAQAAGTAVAAGNSVPQATQQGYSLFKSIDSRNPSYLGDDKDVKLYRNAQAFETSGMSPNDALAAATRAADDRSTSLNISGMTPRDARSAALGQMGGGWFGGLLGGGPGLSSAANASVVQDRIIQQAALLQRNAPGMSAKDAIANAAKSVTPQFTMVGNQALYTGDKSVPDHFGDLANRFKSNWVSAHPDDMAGRTADDVQVYSAGSGAGWSLRFSDGTSPPVGHGQDFSLPDLHEMQKQSDAEAQAQRDAIINKGATQHWWQNLPWSSRANDATPAGP